MKLTLIKPTIGRPEHSLYVDEGRMEPLNLGVLAALTPPDVEVVMYDDRCEPIPYGEATDLVGITVETYTARRSYEIAAEYRRRGVPVVMGGFQPTFVPEECAQHADALVIGDAETIWAQVIADARAGALKPRYAGPPGLPQTGVMTRRDIYEGKGYLPLSLMQYSRGCRFVCDFCSVTEYFGRKHYIRRIDETLAEIETQNRRLIFFVDDNIASDRKALKELCHALIGMRINWVSQASLDVTTDPELMELMARSGCLGHIMGFESITRASVKEAKKAPNLGKFDGYATQIKVLRDYGFQTWAAFTLGYDHDTADSVKATLDFALENRFTFAAFNILMPYPGTPFYDRLAREGRLLYDGEWWLHPEYRFNDASFVPAQMTPDELTALCYDARKEFNKVSSLLWRFSDVKTNLRTLRRAREFWRFTPIFRREVFKKHGMQFGHFGAR
ncbi:MAG: B12-binding domain-containing radical SAM protein [Maritimibacter sp.]|nr:B12-binding domain-containing radical SAM protein [Maritimibacter sp.]